MPKTTRTVEWDKETKSIIVTEQKKININTEDIEEVKKSFKQELRDIIRQVKALKQRAEEIKSLLTQLEEKAGSIDPAS